MNKIPKTVEELNLVEVLDVEFGIKSIEENGSLRLLNEAVMPSDEELYKAKLSLLDKYKKNEYAKHRQKSYPSIAEQLDALFHDIENNTLTTDGSFFKMLNEIKQRFPKE